jgi:hypothetical protein
MARLKFEIEYDTDDAQWCVKSIDDSLMLVHSGSSYYRIKFKKGGYYQIGTLSTVSYVDHIPSRALNFEMFPDEIRKQLRTKQVPYFAIFSTSNQMRLSTMSFTG